MINSLPVPGSILLLHLKQRLNFLPINLHKEECGRHAADHLCNGISQPNLIHIPRQAHEISHRQQHKHLPAQGSNGGINTVAQCLEAGTQHDANRRHRETKADGPERRPANDQELLTGIEHPQQQIRRNLEHQETRRHQAQTRRTGDLQCLSDPLRLPGTEVVGNDGNGGTVQAKQRHKEETLQLKVNAKHTGSGLGKALQDLVHAEIHHRTDTVHNNGRNAHRQDLM